MAARLRSFGLTRERGCHAIQCWRSRLSRKLCMHRRKLRHDRHTVLLRLVYTVCGAAAKPAPTQPNRIRGARCTSLVFKRPSHNSKSQQKEARMGRYIEKPAFDFAKYLIMGQPLKWGVW